MERLIRQTHTTTQTTVNKTLVTGNLMVSTIFQDRPRGFCHVLVCFHSGQTARKQAECLAQIFKIGSSHHTGWKYRTNQHRVGLGAMTIEARRVDKIEPWRSLRCLLWKPSKEEQAKTQSCGLEFQHYITAGQFSVGLHLSVEEYNDIIGHFMVSRAKLHRQLSL